MEKYCHKCGAKLSEGNFCSQCGTAISHDGFIKKAGGLNKFFNFFKKKEKSESSLDLSEKNTVETKIIYEDNPDEICHRIELKKCIEQSLPSERGLYPHEILMLSLASSYFQNDNKFQFFWKNYYHVEDPQQLLDLLEEKGFIEPGTLEDTLKKQTIATLKQDLKDLGLKLTGNKAELVNRLLAEGDLSALEKKYSNRVYTLTELGTNELHDNDFIPFIYKNHILNLNIWNISKLMRTEPIMSTRDKIWYYLNEQSLKAVTNHNFNQHEICEIYMCDFLIEEKRYDGALYHSIKSAYFRLFSNPLISSDKQRNEELKDIIFDSTFNYENSIVVITGMTKEKIEFSIEALSLTKEKFCQILQTTIEKFPDSQLFTKDECFKIIVAELNDEKSILEKIYLDAGKRYAKKYDIQM